MTKEWLVVILGLGITFVGFAISRAPRPGQLFRPLRALLGIGLIFAGLALAAIASRAMR